MTAHDVKQVSAMLKGPLITKIEVAEHFGVSRLTLNKSLAREGFNGLPEKKYSINTN